MFANEEIPERGRECKHKDRRHGRLPFATTAIPDRLVFQPPKMTGAVADQQVDARFGIRIRHAGSAIKLQSCAERGSVVRFPMPLISFLEIKPDNRARSRLLRR